MLKFAKNTFGKVMGIGLAALLMIGFMPVAGVVCPGQQAYAASNSLNDATISRIPDQTYTGEAITPKPTIVLEGKTLREGTDYELRYGANTGEGLATVTARGVGSYTGSKSTTFRINPATITRVELSQTRFVYDGTVKRPTVTVYCGDKVLRNGSDYYIESINSMDLVSVGKKTYRIHGTANYRGDIEATFEIVSPDDDNGGENGGNGSGSGNGSSGSSATYTTMLRLYNPNTGEHLFTSDANERSVLVGLGWKYEGQAWKAPKSGKAVYRLYNPNTGEHHYTIDINEYLTLQQLGWNGEGTGWYSDKDEAVAVYRLYNPYAQAFYHHFTIDQNEYTTLIAGYGWRGESVGWYGVK